MSVSLHIGFDDTDSPLGGCTTYIASLLVEKLKQIGPRFLDYPNLVRLNPNIPWKTRGNGALCLRILCPKDKEALVEQTVITTVRSKSEMKDEHTDPAVAILRGEVPEDLEKFSNYVLTDIATVAQALRLVKRHGIRYELLRGERGIIGALAAIGATLTGDHTYELIAYRRKENVSRPRAVDPDSVYAMDVATKPLTFNNVDYETGRILITPRGPDPILYGIRGETPRVVLQAHRMVRALEDVERWVIFRTNHGTDTHLKSIPSLAEVRPYRPIIATGVVSGEPKRIPGGHIIFELSDKVATVDCAAYEPTGSFRQVIAELIQGDTVQVYGGVRPASHCFGFTVNLEKIKVVDLAEKVFYANPRCPQCEASMESEGRYQGFRCPKCGIEDVYVAKRRILQTRRLRRGLYLPPARAHRHLTKPLSRYGMEKNSPPPRLIKNWSWTSAR